MSLSSEAIAAYDYIRGKRPLAVRQFLLLTDRGIVTREIPLRFVTPSALGYMRLERVRLYDRETGIELPRVRLWIAPEDIPYAVKYLEPYRRPEKPPPLQLVPVELKEYERDRGRVRQVVLTPLRPVDKAWLDEAAKKVNGLGLNLRLAVIPGRQLGPWVMVGEYPGRPVIVFDFANNAFYGLTGDLSRFGLMQLNQSADMEAKIIAMNNPGLLSFVRVSVSPTNEESQAMALRVGPK